MHIESLHLKNFRNYDDESIIFKPGLNVIIGDNAQGKTNIVEAIYISCFGKSFRTSKDLELIGFDHVAMHSTLQAVRGNRSLEVKVAYNREKNKHVWINGVTQTKISELIGTFSIVLFSPEDMKLVKDSPSERRRFMDREISAISRKYCNSIVSYNKVLEQRNNLLKLIKNKQSEIDTISIWNEKLSELGIEIMKARLAFINDLEKYSTDIHSDMTAGKEILKLTYQPSFSMKGIEDKEELKKLMITHLEKNFRNDVFKGYTGTGPHKDELTFTINGMDLKSFGSQGQKRTVVLSVKLSEIKLLTEKFGEAPVLLLDDVLSELDAGRQIDILKHTEGIQTIITAAEINEVVYAEIKNPYTIRIENGKQQAYGEDDR